MIENKSFQIGQEEAAEGRDPERPSGRVLASLALAALFIALFTCLWLPTTNHYLCLGVFGAVVLGSVAYHRRMLAELDQNQAALDAATVEQKHLRSQVNQAQKMESVGHLVGGVAHDFNNLLTVVRGYSDLIGAGSTDPNTSRHLKRMAEAIERGVGMTDRLLAFSQIEEEAAIGDVGLAATRAHELLGRLTDPSVQVTLECSVAAGTEVTMATTNVEQVLINLVLNAVDAIEDSGHIAITVTPGLEGFVKLTVSDDGSGMSPESVELCTTPFFTSKGVGEGTGLGLAVVDSLVSKADGILEISSQLGVGTIVKVTLPTATNMDPVVSTQRDLDVEMESDSQSISASSTILICEYDSSVRDVIETTLVEAGYKTIAVDSVVEARELLTQADLVLSDSMFGKIGSEALPRSIDANEGRTIPVLYMSGYPSEFPTDRFEATNLSLTKPFSNDQLLESIGLLLTCPDSADQDDSYV